MTYTKIHYKYNSNIHFIFNTYVKANLNSNTRYIPPHSQALSNIKSLSKYTVRQYYKYHSYRLSILKTKKKTCIKYFTVPKDDKYQI